MSYKDVHTMGGSGNHEETPRDILLSLLQRIDRGDLKPDKIIVVLMENNVFKLLWTEMDCSLFHFAGAMMQDLALDEARNSVEG